METIELSSQDIINLLHERKVKKAKFILVPKDSGLALLALLSQENEKKNDIYFRGYQEKHETLRKL